LLINPFYNPAVKYSESSTGIRRLVYGPSYTNAGLAIKQVLEDAGWAVVDLRPSEAVQRRPGYYFSAGLTTGEPVPMTPAQCKSTRGPEWARASAADALFNSYDPNASIPICPEGTAGIVWYPFEATQTGTAANLTDFLNLLGIWDVTMGAVDGGDFAFTFISSSPAFEADEVPIIVGAGPGTTLKGYYTLRSPEIDGEYLEIKIQTRMVSGLGGFLSYDGLGRAQICLGVTSSGGGNEFYMPINPGTYNVCANEHQFLLWPEPGAEVTRTDNSSLLVSHIQPMEEHLTAGIKTMVIGSYNGDLNGRGDQLRETLHWNESLGSGYSGQLFSSGFRAGDCDGYQKIAMLVRGTRGYPTVSIAGQPLIEAPYVLLPSTPLPGPPPMIAGKLWDIVMTTGNAKLGSTMMYDGNTWTCFSRSVPVGDVLNDMWILGQAG
jgi:hypothetical protein